MNKTLLVVDDDPELRQLLQEYLSEQGYTVLLASDGVELRAQIKTGTAIDLVILDLMLPGEDGFSLCRYLHEVSKIPVLMLTARGESIDRIVGLEMGADDYLPKPFIPRELLARIKNILRRTSSDEPAATTFQRWRFAGWLLNVQTYDLTRPDGVVIPLPAGEFRLLKALAAHPHCVMSRDQLLDALSQREAEPFDRTVDVMISRLRKRFNDAGSNGLEMIKTVRSGGYALSVDVEQG